MATLLVALVMEIAAPAFAVGGEAARHFRDGIEAADRGEWRSVVAEMNRAIALEPTAGGRVKIYGMRFEAYVPHFWLGVAHDELGDCAAALRAFEVLSGSGTHAGEWLAADQERSLGERAERCRDQVAAQSPPSGGVLETSDAPGDASSVDEPATREPAPPFLRRAAANYLAGDYEAVTSSLETLEALTGDRRAIGTGLLLRGAARYALFRRQTSPEKAELLELARRDLVEFRRLEPDRRPSDFWFSPDLLALYDEAASPGARQKR